MEYIRKHKNNKTNVADVVGQLFQRVDRIMHYCLDLFGHLIMFIYYKYTKMLTYTTQNQKALHYEQHLTPSILRNWVQKKENKGRASGDLFPNEDTCNKYYVYKILI